MNLLLRAGMLMVCLRASVTIVDERRRGMLAPLVLAGITPARLVWSKLKDALRPAVPLTAIVVILWVTSTGRATRGGFTDPRLWLDSLGVLDAAGTGYYLAVSLGLLASSFAPSLRVALLSAPAPLVAWNSAHAVVPQVLRMAYPGISSDTLFWRFVTVGGEPGPQINRLTFHVAGYDFQEPPSWVVSWIAIEALAGLAAWIAAVFRVSREHGRPAGRPDRARPEPA